MLIARTSKSRKGSEDSVPSVARNLATTPPAPGTMYRPLLSSGWSAAVSGGDSSGRGWRFLAMEVVLVGWAFEPVRRKSMQKQTCLPAQGTPCCRTRRAERGYGGEYVPEKPRACQCTFGGEAETKRREGVATRFKHEFCPIVPIGMSKSARLFQAATSSKSEARLIKGSSFGFQSTRSPGPCRPRPAR